VTVAPKSGGLLDGVCQPTAYPAAQAAPVSAGAWVAPAVTATVAAAAVSMTASAALPRRLERIRMVGSREMGPGGYRTIASTMTVRPGAAAGTRVPSIGAPSTQTRLTRPVRPAGLRTLIS
jgi:hypothetical protein